jgi:MFS family permease
MDESRCAVAPLELLAPVAFDLRLPPEVALGLTAVAGAIVAFTVQPLAAALSDVTRSRLGRRRPWIVVGTVLDVLILLAMASSGAFFAFALLFLALQFASNLAQGPYQAYIPDLVPDGQVGLASGLKAMMNAGGQLVGAAIGGLAVALGDPRYGFLMLALLVAATSLPALIGIRDRPAVPGPATAGTRTAAVREALAEAWSNRPFVWLMASMLFLLMGTATLLVVAKWFLTRSLAYTETEAAAAIVVVLALTVASALGTAVWGGRASDRLGRRRVIWLSVATSGAGMACLTLARPDPELVLLGARFPAFGLAAIPVGAGAGMYLAANWALLVDVIPRATAGRHLGISNIVTASSGALAALAASLVMAAATGFTGDAGSGPRAAVAAALVWYLAGSVALRNVKPARPASRGRPAAEGQSEEVGEPPAGWPTGSR